VPKLRGEGGIQQYSFHSILKNRLSKWHIFFLVFLVVYLVFLLQNLDYMTLQWDEANHLNGGLVLLHGHLDRYVRSSLFYPPLDDLLMAGYFGVGGASLFTGRLVSVTFSILTLVLIFGFTRKVYGSRIALISAIFFGSMPGIIWSSRLAMLETMLVFFFSASMMTFFVWLRRHESKYLFLSGIFLGLGFLTKYQIIIAILAMVLSILLLCRGRIKTKLAKIPLLLVVAVLIVTPWIVVSYQVYSSSMIGEWMYALQIGNPEKALYGARFGSYATPIFYLIEMTWPYGSVHPISFLPYAIGLAGIGFLIWRRKPIDKFLLLWFFVVYAFFTLIGNKQWRYVVPLFPVIAISAANLIEAAYLKLEKTWKQSGVHLVSKHAGKVAAVLLTGLVALSVVNSGADAYTWIHNDSAFRVPTQEAVTYVAHRLNATLEQDSLLVVCPLNIFSRDTVAFYLYSKNYERTYVGQYPQAPVDTYTPIFKMSELIDKCNRHNVKYLLLVEYGQTYPYFESTLTMNAVHQLMLESPRFEYRTSFGEYPCRIYIFYFT
jgi:hypothetical protein